jgi:hypothetical protein
MKNPTIEPTAPAPAAGGPVNAANAKADALQRWIRPPAGGSACPFTGMKHAAFYREFVGCPRIRQARMGTGAARGTRLLWLPDIHAEITRRAEAQSAEAGD